MKIGDKVKIINRKSDNTTGFKNLEGKYEDVGEVGNITGIFGPNRDKYQVYSPNRNKPCSGYLGIFEEGDEIILWDGDTIYEIY